MEGNVSERKDSMTTCVIAGTTSSVHSKSRQMGMGSSSQLFSDDFKIIFLTSSSDTGRKDEREQATDCCSSLSPKHTNWAWLSRLWWLVFTLLKKMSAKCWGSWTEGYTVGRAEDFSCEANWFVMWKSCLLDLLSNIFVLKDLLFAAWTSLVTCLLAAL